MSEESHVGPHTSRLNIEYVPIFIIAACEAHFALFFSFLNMREQTLKQLLLHNLLEENVRWNLVWMVVIT